VTSVLGRSNFCQFGGHDASISRIGLRLVRVSIRDNGKVSKWSVCTTCSGYLQANSDPTMFVLCKWARECGDTRQLPASLTETPLKQSLLIQYVDEFLNNIRKKLGDRFPTFLSDLNESEKGHFIHTLEQDSTIANNFLTDVKEGAERKSVALKLWVGGMTSAKGTRKTYNVAAGGEKEYSPEEREADFKAADKYANKDEIFRTGVEVATIFELIIRKKKEISLERAKRNSPIWMYLKPNADEKSVTQEDLVVCSGCLLEDTDLGNKE
jgi:hypothetical protein